jgi:hypothetical protein
MIICQKALKVLRLQSIETKPAQARNQVLPHRCAIRRETCRTKIRASDVLQPMLQPRCHRPPLADTRRSTLVAELLKLAHLPHSVTLGPRHDMTTIGRAVLA